MKLLHDELDKNVNAINTSGLAQKTEQDNKITEKKNLVLQNQPLLPILLLLSIVYPTLVVWSKNRL